MKRTKVERPGQGKPGVRKSRQKRDGQIEERHKGTHGEREKEKKDQIGSRQGNSNKKDGGRGRNTRNHQLPAASRRRPSVAPNTQSPQHEAVEKKGRRSTDNREQLHFKWKNRAVARGVQDPKTAPFLL